MSLYDNGIKDKGKRIKDKGVSELLPSLEGLGVGCLKQKSEVYNIYSLWCKNILL
jgi:hypothetical protein